MELRGIDFRDDNTLRLYLDDKKEASVSLSNFPVIAQLNDEQREDFEIIDQQYLSFLAIDEVYHVTDLLNLTL